MKKNSLESIITITTWIILHGLLYDKYFSNELYYTNIKNQLIFNIVDVALLFVIAFLYGMRIAIWTKVKLEKALLLKVIHLFVLIGLCPHFLFLGREFLMYAVYAKIFHFYPFIKSAIFMAYMFFIFQSLKEVYANDENETSQKLT